MRCQVLMVWNMSTVVFWVVQLYNLVSGYQFHVILLVVTIVSEAFIISIFKGKL